MTKPQTSRCYLKNSGFEPPINLGFQDKVLINDPMWTVPRTDPIPFTTFRRMIGHGSGQALIVVFRKS